MNILVTGSSGFVGRNLVENLKNIRDGKNRTRPELTITKIYEYDTDSTLSLLEEACEHCDFVFHLAGVNRPEDPSDFMKGNSGIPHRPLCGFGIREIQACRRGGTDPVCRQDRGAGAHLPFPESVWQMVPSEL